MGLNKVNTFVLILVMCVPLDARTPVNIHAQRLQNKVDQFMVSTMDQWRSLSKWKTTQTEQHGLPSWKRVDDKSSLKKSNEDNLANMFDIIDSGGWQKVVDSVEGVSIWKKKVSPGTHGACEGANDIAAEKFMCIKATAVLKAPPLDIYRLFLYVFFLNS